MEQLQPITQAQICAIQSALDKILNSATQFEGEDSLYLDRDNNLVDTKEAAVLELKFTRIALGLNQGTTNLTAIDLEMDQPHRIVRGHACPEGDIAEGLDYHLPRIIGTFNQGRANATA